MHSGGGLLNDSINLAVPFALWGLAAALKAKREAKVTKAVTKVLSKKQSGGGFVNDFALLTVPAALYTGAHVMKQIRNKK